MEYTGPGLGSKFVNQRFRSPSVPKPSTKAVTANNKVLDNKGKGVNGGIKKVKRMLESSTCSLNGIERGGGEEKVRARIRKARMRKAGSGRQGTERAA